MRVPPGTPKTGSEALQKSFMDTMRDPEFLWPMRKKATSRSIPRAARMWGKAVDSLFQLEPSLVVKMKTILLGDLTEAVTRPDFRFTATPENKINGADLVWTPPLDEKVHLKQAYFKAR